MTSVPLLQMDLTSVYETCQNSHMGFPLICYNLSMHFLCIICSLKENFQNHKSSFRNDNFRNFVKTTQFIKFKRFMLFFSDTEIMQITCTKNLIEKFHWLSIFSKHCNLKLFDPKILYDHQQS